MILTLPERALRPFEEWSFSFRLPPGVDGCDRGAESGGLGDRRGFEGDVARGGVLGRFLGAMGVAGMSCSSGADCAETKGGGMGERFRPLFRPRDWLFFSCSSLLRGPSSLNELPLSAVGMEGLDKASCNAFLSALRFNIHHIDPAESHALARTE